MIATEKMYALFQVYLIVLLNYKIVQYVQFNTILYSFCNLNIAPTDGDAIFSKSETLLFFIARFLCLLNLKFVR